MLGRWRTARRAEAERAAAAERPAPGARARTRAGGGAGARSSSASCCSGSRSKRPRPACGSRAAVERLRTEYDVEPEVALDAPAPEVPDGTTLAGRARELERELRLMGPINPLALEEYEALLERHEFLQAAARRREERAGAS